MGANRSSLELFDENRRRRQLPNEELTACIQAMLPQANVYGACLSAPLSLLKDSDIVLYNQRSNLTPKSSGIRRMSVSDECPMIRDTLAAFYLGALRTLPITRDLFTHYDAMKRERDDALARCENFRAERDAAIRARDDALKRAIAPSDRGSEATDVRDKPEARPIGAADYILWAYRLLLGREPENIAAVRNHPPARRQEIVSRFIGSPEFRSLQQWPGIPQGKNFWFIAELSSGTRFWVCANDAHVSRGVARGEYEPIESAFIRRHVKPGMNAVDIGANIGWYTVLMAGLVGPSGHVDAFEPRQDIAHYLQRTITENKLRNVNVHHCALGAFDGEGRIAFGNENFGATHLTEGQQEGDDYTEEVIVRRLDSVVSRVTHFIKIDVEGAEKLVFDGAGQLLEKDRPLALLEINNECLLRTSKISSTVFRGYLHSRGYEIRHVLPEGRYGAPVSEQELSEAAHHVLNVACVPVEKVAELSVG